MLCNRFSLFVRVQVQYSTVECTVEYLEKKIEKSRGTVPKNNP